MNGARVKARATEAVDGNRLDSHISLRKLEESASADSDSDGGDGGGDSRVMVHHHLDCLVRCRFG